MRVSAPRTRCENAYRSGESLNRGPHQVFLGSLDHVNPACRYAFPTALAAQRFALAHKLRAPARRVIVTDADGGAAAMEVNGLVS
jgi:hypothetical protein